MSLTLILVIVTCLISYQAMNNASMKYKLYHSPYQEAHQKEYYRFLTSGFVHGSWMHLGINMFVFYQFGEYVESQFLSLFGEMMGRVNYLLLYLLAIIFANIGTFIKHRNNQSFASLGASGATSAILFAFIIFQPWSMLLIFFVIPCPAIIAAVLYLVYSSWAVKNSPDNIDHDAHFYGAVFGFLFTILLKPELFNVFVNNVMNNTPF